MEPMSSAEVADRAESIRSYAGEAAIAPARPQPEAHRALEWLHSEADRLQALVVQVEDALSAVLPPWPEEERRDEDSPGFRSQLGQNVGGAAARIQLANGRLAELVERVRVVL